MKTEHDAALVVHFMLALRGVWRYRVPVGMWFILQPSVYAGSA